MSRSGVLQAAVHLLVLALALAQRATGYMVLAFFAEDANGVQGARHPRHVLELRTRPRLLFKQLPNFLGNIEFNGALLSVVVDSPTQPPRQLRPGTNVSSASVGSIHLCVHELVITQSRRGRGFVKDADADASKS